jgi:hypothetical protein
MTYATEWIVPIFIFATRFLRHVACALLIGLQIVIEATGNFGFFNLLSIVLCVPLLDDRLLSSMSPARWVNVQSFRQSERKQVSNWYLVPLVLICVVSCLTFVREMAWTVNREALPRSVVWMLDTTDRVLLSWGQRYILRWTNPFHTINGYGLFRVMTTERPEIVIEVSNDGSQWYEQEFRWKPGDLKRRPPIVAPHQPRLDWQMWFGALNPRGSADWLHALMQRILDGSPQVGRLLKPSPLPSNTGPPRYVRLMYYRYEFTDWNERGGNWWKRTKVGQLTEPQSLPGR